MEDQLCRGRVVVLQCGLWLFPGSTGSGFPGWCRPRLATTCVVPGATQHELQGYLQVAGNCVGLGGAPARHAVNQGLLLLVPGLGPSRKRYRELLGTDDAYLRGFRKI